MCREQDIAILLPMMEAFTVGEGRAFDRERCETNLRYLLTHREFGGVWFIRADNADVGYLVVTLGFSFEFGGHDSFIDEIYVNAALRGRGIGTRTLQFAEQAARALGARWLHLEASRRKEGLDDFYARNDFRDRGYSLLSKPLDADRGD
jgi:GNAT superfamily N-acetyltransferase